MAFIVILISYIQSLFYFRVPRQDLQTVAMDSRILNATDASGLINTSVDTPESNNSLQDLDWLHIQDGFYIAGYVITPIVLIIGVFGNTMTILTVSSKSFSDLTSRYILIALALSDTTLIVLQPFNKLFVRDLFGFDVRAYSDGGCKFFFWLFRTSKMTSSWLIVILCFERFIAVVFPLKARKIVNKKSILALIFLDYFVIGTYNGFWSFSSVVENGVCKPDAVFPDTIIKYRNFMVMGTSLYTFIPMTVMVILTPIIVWKLIKKRKRRQTIQLDGGRVSKKDLKEVKASLVLIGIVVAFIVLVLPIAIMFFIAFWQSVSAFETNTLSFFIYREVAQHLELVNYSVNFFMYIMCSDTFRKKALQILRCPCNHTKVAPGVTTSDNNTSSNQMATSTARQVNNAFFKKGTV